MLGEDGPSTIDIGRSRMLVLDQSLCHCRVPSSQILNAKYRRAAKRPKFKTSLSFPIGKQHVSRNGVVFLHSCWGGGRRNARLAASPPPGIFSSSHSKDRSPRQPFPAQKKIPPSGSRLLQPPPPLPYMSVSPGWATHCCPARMPIPPPQPPEVCVPAGL